MSKWGYEESETIEAINKIKFKGKVLNLAAGDGRFNNELLKFADKVIAVDKDENELKELIKKCPSKYKDKLKIEIIDLLNKFPFEDNSIDGVFCTGTLHLFNEEEIKRIVSEIRRVLKPEGKIIIDFATDIKRIKENGELIIHEGEGEYTTQNAIEILKNIFSDFKINFEVCNLPEEDLIVRGVLYKFKCNFLIISGNKKKTP